MNSKSNIESLLNQISEPAFIVQNGIITAVNATAANRFIETGFSVEDFISQGKEEYSQLENGSLYLTVTLCGAEYPCVVTCLEDGNLFTIETEAVQPELKVLSLAAQQLSFPVSELTLLLDQLEDNPKKAQISQNLFRLKRIIGNMADTSRYETTVPNLTNCNVCGVFDEILEKAQTLLNQSGIQLTYHLPNQTVYSLVNQEMLQRAVYNLLSNAAKFSDDKKSVDAQLKLNNNKLYFTVTSQNGCKNIDSNMFSRYLRQPGLEDRKYGLGLGMALVHAAAAAHNGTVLIQQDKNHKIQVTMSLTITKSTQSTVRSPMLFPDVYGGIDQALIELSDILSTELYQ